MAQQTINVGAAPNDGTGTPLRTAFQYTNSNFSELYTAVGPSGNNIVVPGNATITGDLTVDTSTLKVDSANNRVGIGTASPGVRVDILSDSNTSLAPVLRVNSNNVAVNAALAYDGLIGSSTMHIQSGTSAPLIFNTNNVNERYRIASDGVATWSNVGGVAGTAMTLNATGLGVGASPNAKLTVYGGGATTSTVNFSGGSAGTDNATIASNYNLTFQVDANNTIGGREFVWRYGGKGYGDGTLLMKLDASGNLLVGLATAGTTAAKTIQIADGTAPTANVTGGQLYVEAGALKYRGSSGTVTTIANA